MQLNQGKTGGACVSESSLKPARNLRSKQEEGRRRTGAYSGRSKRSGRLQRPWHLKQSTKHETDLTLSHRDNTFQKRVRLIYAHSFTRERQPNFTKITIGEEKGEGPFNGIS